MSGKAASTMAAASREREGHTRRLWDRIEQRRAELDIDVITLARMIGMSRDAYYQWKRKAVERGFVPNADHLVALEQALRLPYGELLELAGKPAPGITKATPVSISIMAAEELTDTQKQALLQVYETFMQGRRHRSEE